MPPPQDFDRWVDVNPEGMSVATQPDSSVRLSFKGSKTYALHGKAHALPPGPFAITIAVQAGFGLSTTGAFFALRESATGHIMALTHIFNGGWANGGGVGRWGSTAGDLVKLDSQVTYPVTNLVWLRINDDGMTRKFLYSADGIYYLEVFESPSSFWLTAADQIAILGYDGNSGSPYSFVVKHWSTTH